MKKYPHGLNLRAVCAAIDAFEAQQDGVPESGMIAAFEILLTASGIVQRAEASEAALAELSLQQPIGWLNDAYLGRGVIDGEVGKEDQGPGYIPIYRHPFNDVPAAAINLAELVPPEADGSNLPFAANGWTAGTPVAAPSCATFRRRNND